MARNKCRFDDATRKHKKVKKGNSLTFKGEGKAKAKPKVSVYTWTMLGNQPRGRKEFAVPAGNIMYNAGTEIFSFMVGIRHADLIEGYPHLAYLVTDQNTETDHVTFRVVGAAPREVKDPLGRPVELHINTPPDPNDIDPGADLPVTGTIGNYQAGMHVYIERYTLVMGRLGNKITYEASIAPDGTGGWNFSAVIPEDALDPDQDYVLVAVADVEHVPDAIGIHTEAP